MIAYILLTLFNLSEMIKLVVLSLALVAVTMGFNQSTMVHSDHLGGGQLYNKIALAAQGKASEVSGWTKMVSLMNTKSSVILFLLSYDVPIDSDLCNNISVFCVFKPGSSWTSGRNELTLKIAEIQSERKHKFKYWMMVDQDNSRLYNCGPATHCQPPEYPALSAELGACCFDVALSTLLAPEVQYAIVNFHISGKIETVDWLSFSHMDCADGSLNAFHHAAVPVILPYVELVDKVSWWESQGIQYHLITGCFPGYSVYSNVFSIKMTSSHTEYPHGRNAHHATRALRHVYGELGLIPNPISMRKVELGQANCADHDFNSMGLVRSYEPKIDRQADGEEALKTVWKSDAWLNMTSFKMCLGALTPRYLKFIATRNITAIDGAVYQP